MGTDIGMSHFLLGQCFHEAWKDIFAERIFWKIISPQVQPILDIASQLHAWGWIRQLEGQLHSSPTNAFIC